MRRWSGLLGAVSVVVLTAALVGCSTDEAGSVSPASAPATVTYTVPPITVVSTAPAETETVIETETVTTGPTTTVTETRTAPAPVPEQNSDDLTWWNCDRLVKQAAETSQQTGRDPYLLKVREPVVEQDNRKTVEPPTGSNTSIVLTCKGLAVWSRGDDSEVSITLSIDADSDLMISYRS